MWSVIWNSVCSLFKETVSTKRNFKRPFIYEETCRFTMVPFKLCLDNDAVDIYPHGRHGWRLSARGYSVHCILSVQVYTVRSRSFLALNFPFRYMDKNIYEILDIKQRFKVYRCKSDRPLYNWKVNWNYAYSPFKLVTVFLK